MRRFLLILYYIMPLITISQVQIGNDVKGETSGDLFGYSLSISNDGNIMAIGAYANDNNGPDSGHVRIYQRVNNNWIQIGQDINGELPNDFSGVSVDLNSDGTIVAIGSSNNTNSNGVSAGHVRIFELSDTKNWVQVGSTIQGKNAQDRFGREVVVSKEGNLVAVSSIYAQYTGTVCVFKNVSNSWTQIGSEIKGDFNGDQFGFSIDLSQDGKILAIGSRLNNGGGNSRGQVKVFEFISDNWFQLGTDINGKADGDMFGAEISLNGNGNFVAVGSIFNDSNGDNSGQARVFKLESDDWMQIGDNIDGENDLDFFGYSLELNSTGTILAVSATGNDNNGENSGYVRIYDYLNSQWIKRDADIYGKNIGDRSGYTIDFNDDGNMLAISSIYNDDNGEDSGHVRVFDLSQTLTIQDKALSGIKLIPNPAKNHTLIVGMDFDQFPSIIIYNLIGQEVLTSTETRIETASLEAGIYWVHIKSKQGFIRKKLIIK